MNPQLIVSLMKAIDDWSNDDANNDVIPSLHSWGNQTIEMMATAAAAVLIGVSESQQHAIDTGDLVEPE